MLLPEKFTVNICTRSLVPVAGACIHLQFCAIRKNHYHYVAGPSNGEGDINVQRSELLVALSHGAELFPMDYNLPHENLSGVLQIRLLGLKELLSLKEFYESHKDHWDLDKEYGSRLARCIAEHVHVPRSQQLTIKTDLPERWVVQVLAARLEV